MTGPYIRDKMIIIIQKLAAQAVVSLTTQLPLHHTEISRARLHKVDKGKPKNVSSRPFLFWYV